MKNRLGKLVIVVLVVLVAISACSSPQVAATPANTRPPATTPVNTSTPRPTATLAPTEAPSPTPEPRADIIFYNGQLITMEASQPMAQAIALSGDVIQAVGTDQEILALQGPQTQLIDLQGRTLLPGFIDGHTHILAFHDRLGRSLEDAQDTALRYGFTSLNEMWADQGYLDKLMQAEKEGDLRLRVNVFASYNDGILDGNRQKVILGAWYPAHAPILDPERFLRIPGIKIFVDGDNAERARGCWALSEPFEAGAPLLKRGVCGSASGDLYWTQDELNRVVAKAQGAGYRVAFHAMGDRAIETAINAIESALDGESNQNYRHQIEHNSLVRPDLLPRYQALGLYASLRGHMDVCDLEGLKPAFGDRYTWYINRLALPGLGIHAYIETDYGWTVDPDDRYSQRTLDPIMHIFGIVTHRYAAAQDSVCEPDPLAAAYKTSVERALQMLTIEPAYAVSMEDHLGSLKAGKYADLVVISDNPLTVDPGALKDLRVWMTMVAGKAAYCAQGQEALCSQKPAANLPTSGNLALHQKVTASMSRQSTAAGAVDGFESTFWGAGDFAPQWIQVDLGGPATITEIRLLVGQSPDGKTQHRVLAGGKKDDLSEIHRFNQVTRDGDWLVYTPGQPLEGVQFIRVETLSSPSWVAWSEIQVFGTR